MAQKPQIKANESHKWYLACVCYHASMNNSINANGLSFRLQDDEILLITTPTGQYQVQPQGVADLFDLLSAGQGGFLDTMPDLPIWARGTIGQTVVGQVQQADEEEPTAILRNVSAVSRAALKSQSLTLKRLLW
jgi:hypothetical protein